MKKFKALIFLTALALMGFVAPGSYEVFAADDGQYYDVARTPKDECLEWWNDVGQTQYYSLDTWSNNARWDWYCTKWDADNNQWVPYRGSNDACNYNMPDHSSSYHNGCTAYGKLTPPVSPVLNVSPTTVNLSATQGTGTITCGGSGQGSCPSVWNSGGGTLSWTTSPTSPDGWLSWTPASDGNGPTTLWVSATIDGLAAGPYSKTITVTGAAGTQNSPQTVTVNLTICGNTAPSVTTLSSPSNGATGQSTSPMSKPLPFMFCRLNF